MVKKRKRIPLLPFPLPKAMKLSRRFLGIGETLSHMFPGAAFHLEQSGYDFDEREWMALAFFTALFYFLILAGPLSLLTIAAKIEPIRAIGISFLVGFVIGFVSLIYLAMYPKLSVTRKVNQIEHYLPYGLHHLLIEVRSGVPLYNALVSIAQSNYGMLSGEFKRAVNEINTGKSEIAALEMLAKDNPSLYFRRVIWQMVNALKSGADIGQTIKQIVDNLSEEQRISIKKYGAQLNPLALMYMIFCVIFPTLGITFLLVISSFIGIGFDVQYLLIGILAFLMMFQFMLIGLIKSRRPVGI
jgi:flagellar protein FlaJ